MNNALSAIDAYRHYRAAKAKSKLYRTFRYLFVSLAAAYVFLLFYPQVLFAHQISYKNFTVYSRKPLDQSIYPVLDKVEATLSKSEINNTQVRPRIFLTNSKRLYSSLTLNIGYDSFGKGLVPAPQLFRSSLNASDAFTRSR